MARFNKDGTIDLIYSHPTFGDIPFTASPNDSAELGRDLFARALNGEFGVIEPYVISVADKKAERQKIVDAITVVTTSGKEFDGNEDAQSRMSRAIQASQIANIQTTTWVLANNVPTSVTLAELQEALVLSIQAMGTVWTTPYE